MTINTGVSASLRRPQTFHKFIYLKGGRSLVALDQSVALIGMKSAAGTATAEVPVAINDADEADTLFGLGSELALMARKALATIALRGGGPRLFGVPQVEPGAGTASANTITITGPATAGGTIELLIAGRSIFVGVASGDAQNTIATAVSNAIKALYFDLPITCGVAANVVTCTHVTKGENGQDVAFSTKSMGTVLGVTVAHANSIVGAGVTDITAALDALQTAYYDGIATANHKAADIADALTHVTTTWGVAEKKWRWVFFGERGTIGTATALAGAANHTALMVVNCEASPSLPGEIATAACVAAFSVDRPNANFDGMRLPLYPPTAANAFTGTEVETAIAAGLTALTPIFDGQNNIIGGVVKIERMITTKTTETALPYDLLRDMAVSRVGAYMARQVDIAYAPRFQGNPDAVIDDETKLQIKDMVINLMYSAQALSYLKNVDADKALVVVEDSATIGRVDVDIPYTAVMPLHQAAFVHRVTV